MYIFTLSIAPKTRIFKATSYYDKINITVNYHKYHSFKTIQ